jgi:cobalt-zinc-cadmium efflux system outer membrane protein
LERLVSYNRSRVSEGGTAEVELLRVELELDRATANVTFAEVDLVKSQADLWPIVSAGGLNGPRVRLRVAVPNAGSLRATLAPQATFVTRAREHRSEVLGASARVAAATADTDLQRALTVRQVGATFGLKRVGGANSMIAGLSVPLPLFDRNRGEVQRADAELLAAEQERSWAERVVSAEIQAAYDGAERLSAEVSRLQPSFLNRAEDVNRITIGAYQEGAATLLQVIDAARTLGDARLTYFRAVIAQRQSVFDLAMAAGEEPEAALTASARTDTWLTRESLRAEDRQR